MSIDYIRTDNITLAYTNELRYKLLEGDGKLLDWSTSEIKFPVYTDKLNLPFKPSLCFTRMPEFISVTIEKPRNLRELVIKLGNFESLPELSDIRSELHIRLSGSLKDSEFPFESEYAKVEKATATNNFEAVAQVLVTDDFFDDYRKYTGRSLQAGSLMLEAFWELSFRADKDAHFKRLLNCTSNEIQELEGTIRLVSGSEKSFKISKGVLAGNVIAK